VFILAAGDLVGADDIDVPHCHQRWKKWVSTSAYLADQRKGMSDSLTRTRTFNVYKPRLDCPNDRNNMQLQQSVDRLLLPMEYDNAASPTMKTIVSNTANAKKTTKMSLPEFDHRYGSYASSKSS